MKAFSNVSPRSITEALKVLGQSRAAAVAGGGSDLLGMVKERLAEPDVLVHLRSIRGLDQISQHGGGIHIGGLATLASISEHPVIRQRYAVLAEAAASVATPQIRNVGTIAGNVCQRPWCWYFRNGFKCLKAGGDVCYSIAGENQFHAIFGGGPSFIVHPSDTAPALVALDATFRIAGARGERVVPAAEFFALPSVDASRENVLAPGELLIGIDLPAPAAATRSTYHKILDREAWTHAVVSVAAVLRIEAGVCRGARIVLGGVAPIPWRVPKAEAALVGNKITPDAAAEAGEAAVEGAAPMAKNGYKIPLTRAAVKRTLMSLA